MSNVTAANVMLRQSLDTASYEVKDESCFFPEDIDSILDSYRTNGLYSRLFNIVVTRFGRPLSLFIDHQTVNPGWEMEQATSPKLDVFNAQYQLALIEEDSEILVDLDLVANIPPKNKRNMVFRVLNRRRGRPSSIDDEDIMWGLDVSE